jgi:hypothetical protein
MSLFRSFKRQQVNNVVLDFNFLSSQNMSDETLQRKKKKRR